MSSFVTRYSVVNLYNTRLKERSVNSVKIKTILLDIGGVLVEFAGIKRLIELMGNKITPDELSRRWAASEYVKLYESGKCDTTIFANGIIKELDMHILPEDFIAEFVLFTKDFFPGAIALLQALKQKYTLACLSNTNIVQWNGLCDRILIDKYFHYNFLSYETGKLKPEIDAYSYAVGKLGCEPDEIAFFDDNDINVKSAINIGINAYKVFDFNDMKEKLKSLNLL
jgi:putative hydrolase of the HAD superfamily